MTPYFEAEGVRLYCGDALAVLPTLEAGSVDAVITDPPYGCNKAEWDDKFPVLWYREVRKIARMIIIITGAAGLKDTIPLVGNDFIDVIAARNLNSLTRGTIGFNNWLAAVVAVNKPQKTNSWNFFEFSVRRTMPDHPSPKPIEYMQKLVWRVTRSGDTILDPFTGSGTTAVAAIQLGRRFVGVEISEAYCEIAARRIERALQQPRLFVEDAPQAQPEQGGLW